MIKKISITLEFGRIYTGLLLIFFYMMFFLSVLASCLIFIIALTEDSRLFLVFLLCCIIAICFAVVIIINHKNCLRVKEWLNDAVKLKAYAKKLDESKVYSGIIPLKATKIIVTFIYNGQHVSKMSGKQDKAISRFNGYSPALEKYVDREFDIMYSPKYDQVMILKSNN